MTTFSRHSCWRPPHLLLSFAGYFSFHRERLYPRQWSTLTREDIVTDEMPRLSFELYLISNICVQNIKKRRTLPVRISQNSNICSEELRDRASGTRHGSSTQQRAAQVDQKVKDPGCPSSVRISILRDFPTIPDQAPNTKCNVPVSL